MPTVRYIEVPGTCTGHRHHKHHGDIEGEDLEIGAVDKLLVGELGEDRVQHGDGHQDLTHFLSDNINVISFHVQDLLPDNIIQSQD